MTSQPAQAEVMKAAHRVNRRSGVDAEVVASPHKWTAGAVVRKDNPTDAERIALLRSIG